MGPTLPLALLDAATGFEDADFEINFLRAPPRPRAPDTRAPPRPRDIILRVVTDEDDIERPAREDMAEEEDGVAGHDMEVEGDEEEGSDEVAEKEGKRAENTVAGC